MFHTFLSSRLAHVAEAGIIFIVLCLAAVAFLARFSRNDDPEDRKPEEGEESSERLMLRDYEQIWKKEIEL
jgi:hypothetical protein